MFSYRSVFRFRRVFASRDRLFNVFSFNRTPYISVNYLGLRQRREQIGDNKVKLVSSSFRSFSCWHCGSVIQSTLLKCGACGSVQEVRSHLSYFELLGIPESYSVDLAALTGKFREMQNHYHPDRFVNKQEGQAKAQEVSSHINIAYKTLQDPVLRGIYMLQLHSVDFPEDIQSNDIEFLSLIMDLNMEVEEAQTLDKIKYLKKQIGQQFENQQQLVGQEFYNKQFNIARDHIIKLKYFGNLKQTISDKEFELQITGN